jgi:hypothetical protein
MLHRLSQWGQGEGDEVVLSKIVLSNFHPKQANKLIGGLGASQF